MKDPQEGPERDSGGAAAPGGHLRTTGRGGLLIWALATANLLLAGGAYLFTRYLAGAESYLLAGSSEFGSDLQAAQAGLGLMRAAAWVLIAGFIFAGIGLMTRSRAGYAVQLLWAALLCLTLAGLVYGLPAIVILRARAVRERFFPARVPID